MYLAYVSLTNVALGLPSVLFNERLSNIPYILNIGCDMIERFLVAQMLLNRFVVRPDCDQIVSRGSWILITKLHSFSRDFSYIFILK